MEGRYKNFKHWLEAVWAVIINGYPARKLKVIGVTGTDGKTTTCHLIYEMLKAAGKKVALVSTVAAYIGDEQIDTGFHVTTPDAKFLQLLIKRIVETGMEYLVLEVTSHGLDQHRVLGCNFMVGVVTNITHEHLDYHGSFAK
ncbi:MAG: UDP-N-acetylmuramyl-tripeptide synthetase, partial [Candidatus Amesbacteria bacterium GW2011_GWB1_47_26]